MSISMEEEPVDLLVIGAGPHALSLLSRLVDASPDLLSERQRTHIASRAGSRARSHKAVASHLLRKEHAPTLLPRTVVIDQHGEWLAQWRTDFTALRIAHTRSHADLHPCPYDFQSLRVWAKENRRQGELLPMRWLDREASRRAGYAGPFVLVGTQLFLDFCAAQVDR